MTDDELELLKRDVLEPLAESAFLDGIFEEVEAELLASKQADPEWTTPLYFHQKTLVEAFCYGVISADSLFLPYRLPEDFASVVDFIADRIYRYFNKEEVVKVSLLEIERLFAEWPLEHPSYRAWCEDPPGGSLVQVVTVFDCPDNDPPVDFARMSHTVVGRNAAVYLHRVTLIDTKD